MAFTKFVGKIKDKNSYNKNHTSNMPVNLRNIGAKTYNKKCDGSVYPRHIGIFYRKNLYLEESSMSMRVVTSEMFKAPSPSTSAQMPQAPSLPLPKSMSMSMVTSAMFTLPS